MANRYSKEAELAKKNPFITMSVFRFFANIFSYLSNDPALFIKLKAKAIILFGYIIPSIMFSIIDWWIVQYGLKFFLFAYIFVPILPTVTLPATAGPFISKIFIDFFDSPTNFTLTSMYLLAPLITLYFREHDSIVSKFIGDYEELDNDKAKNKSLLDCDVDDYDLIPASKKLAVLSANKRLLSERSALLFFFEKIAMHVGKKRQKDRQFSSLKIIFIIALLIPGMLLSGAPKTSIYFLISAGLLLFIMMIIFVQILYGIRTTVKAIVFRISLDASDYIYQDLIKEDDSKPASIFINE